MKNIGRLRTEEIPKEDYVDVDGNESSSDESVDEDKAIIETATSFFKRSRYFITTFLYNADKKTRAGEHKSERLTALYKEGLLKEFKNRSIASLIDTNNHFGENVYSGLHKSAIDQFLVINNKEDLFMSYFKHYHKFQTSYGRLTTQDFYEYVVFPEMVIHWTKTDKDLCYGKAEKTIFGNRPFHEMLLQNVSGFLILKIHL